MVAGRTARSAAQVWLGEKAAYPIVITCLVASSLAVAHVLRMSTKSPDVAWTKEKRQDQFRYTAEDGADWSSQRHNLATLHKNAINEAKGLNKD